MSDICPLCGKPILDRHRRRETERGAAHLKCPRGVDTRKLRKLARR